jgi:RNA polymerase sigma factor (sigma-70 family)
MRRITGPPSPGRRRARASSARVRPRAASETSGSLTKATGSQASSAPTAHASTSHEEEFAALYASVGPRLRQSARRQVGRADADDVVQEIFFDLWRQHQRGDVDWDAPLEPLLFHALQCRISNVRRRRGRELGFLKRYLGYVLDFVKRWLGLGDGGREDEAEGVAGVVDRLVDDLPERCRAVFLMVHEQEWSYAKVSATLGISVNTVRNQVVRGHRAVREGLERAGYFVTRSARQARRGNPGRVRL